MDAAAANILVSYSNTFYARINGSAGGTSTPGTKGLYAGDRSSSANVVQYWNGASQGTQTSTSAAVLNNSFIIGNAPGAAFPTTNTLSAAFIGASLGAAGQLALYNRLRTYMDAVAPVANSVWSVADAAATGMTLSNGGLTVTSPGGSNRYGPRLVSHLGIFT